MRSRQTESRSDIIDVERYRLLFFHELHRGDTLIFPDKSIETIYRREHKGINPAEYNVTTILLEWEKAPALRVYSTIDGCFIASQLIRDHCKEPHDINISDLNEPMNITEGGVWYFDQFHPGDRLALPDGHIEVVLFKSGHGCAPPVYGVTTLLRHPSGEPAYRDFGNSNGCFSYNRIIAESPRSADFSNSGKEVEWLNKLLEVMVDPALVNK